MRFQSLNSWLISMILHAMLIAAIIITWKPPSIKLPDTSISVDIIDTQAQSIGPAIDYDAPKNLPSKNEQNSPKEAASIEQAPPPPSAVEQAPTPIEATPKPIETKPTPLVQPNPAPKPVVQPPPKEIKPFDAFKKMMQKPQPTAPAPKLQLPPQPTPKPALPTQQPKAPVQKTNQNANKNNFDFKFDVPAASSASSGVNSGVKSGPKLTASGQAGSGKPTGGGAKLKSDLINIVREQIKMCWIEPADMSDPQNLLVELKIELNPNGGLAKSPILVNPSSRNGASPSLRVAIDNAIRATKQCAPFNLPQDRYNEWQNFIFRFDPKKLRH
jgi:hypothetical protein